MSPLVIGLGGTGAWVLTHLKHQLIRRHQGVVPPAVCLLAFDVEPEPWRLSFDARPEFRLVDGVSLAHGEYFRPRCALEPMADAVAGGHLPHVGAWFHAHYWLQVLPRQAFHDPTGGRRSLGRLALFDDLTNPAASEILHALTGAVIQLHHALPAHGLQVYLVSSTFGGTGSAWIADFAHLTRQVADLHGVGVAVHSFLVTPEAFSAVFHDGRQLRSSQENSFATLREINRFQTAVDRDPGSPMFYSGAGNDPILHSRVRGPLFNSVTVVDGQAPVHALSGALPEVGVFPAVAGYLLTLLDNVAGPVPAGVVGAAGGAMTCSTFGCAELTLPVARVVDGMACSLAHETLDVLLAPEPDRPGSPIRLAPDRNPEVGFGFRGRDTVAQFLTAHQLTDPGDPTLVASGTGVMEDIIGLAEVFEDDPAWYLRTSDFVPRYPRRRSEADLQAELASRDRWEWQRIFCPGPGLLADDTARILHTRVGDLCGIKVDLPGCLILKRRRAQAQVLAEAAMRSFQECLTDFLGEELLEPHGKPGQYRQALEWCASWNLQRFSQMLTIQASIILNGISSSAREARGGKLGFFIDFLEGLREALERAHRRLLPPEVEQLVRDSPRDRQAERHSLEDKMRRQLDRPGCLMVLAGSARARLAIQGVLSQADAMADRACGACALMVRLAEAETVRRMIGEVELLHGTATAWVIDHARGLYGGLEQHHRDVETRLADEQQIVTRRVIRDLDWEQSLFHRGSRGDRDAVAELLKDLTWALSGDRERPSLRLQLSGQAVEAGSVAALAGRCREAFTEATGSTSLLDYLLHAQPNPNQWVAWLAAHSDPKLRLAPGPGVPFQAAYLQIAPPQDAAQAAYLNQAVALLSGRLGGMPVHLAVWQDPFTCTLTRTRNGFHLDMAATYQESRQRYLTYAPQGGEGRSLLHVFPAEVNAAELEQRLAELGQEPRQFDDRVTVLLEDIEPVRLFVRCLELGVIRRQDGVQESHYSLFVPDVAGGTAGKTELYLTDPAPADQDLTEAIKTFAYRGQSIGPGEAHRIDYEQTSRALEEARRERIGEILTTPGAELAGYEESQRPILAERLRNLAEQDREEASRLLAEHAHLRDALTNLAGQLEEAGGDLQRDTLAVISLLVADDIRALGDAIERRLSPSARD